MFKLLFKSETGAFVLLNQNSPDMIDYLSQGFAPIFEESRNKRDCLQWLELYWDENYVPDEEKIFVTVA